MDESYASATASGVVSGVAPAPASHGARRGYFICPLRGRGLGFRRYDGLETVDWDLGF